MEANEKRRDNIIRKETETKEEGNLNVCYTYTASVLLSEGLIIHWNITA